MRSPICHSSARSVPLTWPSPPRWRSTKYDGRSGSRPVTDIDVRGIKEDEIPAYLRCLGTAFHMGSTVTDERVEFSKKYMNDMSRRLGAFVGDSLCGPAGSFGADLTVPGGAAVPTACVTQVTVLPTH